MGICSYLVIPGAGKGESLVRRLNGLPGCEAVPSETGDVLMLITETDDREADEALRGRIVAMDGLESLVLTFGEVDVP